MLGNTLWTWGTFREPIRNLEGTPWEHIRKQRKLKKKSFVPPPQFKRNKNKAPWPFLLAERKINPPPSPPIKLTWKVQCPVSEWTLDSPLSTPNIAWKKNLPFNLPTLTQNLKGKKSRHLESMIALPIGLMNFSLQEGSSQFFTWTNTHRNKHPRYIGEKGRILGKTYGFEIRCYWEHPWETHWEFGEQLGKMVGTH